MDVADTVKSQNPPALDAGQNPANRRVFRQNNAFSTPGTGGKLRVESQRHATNALLGDALFSHEMPTCIGTRSKDKIDPP